GARHASPLPAVPHSALYDALEAALREDLCRDLRAVHSRGPATVERNVGDDLDDLFLAQPVVDAAVDVRAQLLRPVECRVHGNRRDAAFALGQTGALPDVAEEPVLGSVIQLGKRLAPVGLLSHCCLRESLNLC